MKESPCDNQALVDQYNKEGYGICHNVLDADIMAETRGHIEWLMEKHPDLRPELLHTSLVIDDPFWVRLVRDERLLDIVEEFIGSNIALFASHYICKPPYDGKPVLWHQDASYWPLKPMEVISIWLAISDSTRKNGCMRVIPKTHKGNLHEYKERNDVDNVLGSSIDPELVDESKAVDLELNAGDLSIHHPNIIHGSDANNSSKWRRGLTIRYIPTSTKILEKNCGCPFLFRGIVKSGINDYLPFPKYIEGKHYPFKDAHRWNKSNS
ncbi:MAG: phytanoyl-CoA dioxygenase family protein [Candidatus Marinimicrobia bacterium]|nr:phytanoyl-CoA dioxygenase family protein [Candidatus Neomarinimicrobiota bacterium]